MELPIRFPDYRDVIYEDAVRFRALSDEERVRALCDCIRDYLFLIEVSGRGEKLRALAEEEERKKHQAIMEFAARHG